MKLQIQFIVLTWMYSRVSATCRTPLGVTSECTSLYECPDLLAAFKLRPLPSNVVNFLRQSQCGFEGYVPRVCCGPLPSFEDAAPTPVRPVRPPANNNRVDPVSSEDSSPSRSPECGQDTNGDRIYGGTFTELDEFPWMALLGYRRNRDGSITYQCGGVLINKRYVLTAAHCVTGQIEKDVGKLVTVRLGEYDVQTDIDCLNGSCADPPQELSVHSSYPHPGYSDQNKNRKDDIALVRLAQRARYTYFVQPICLAGSNARFDDGNDLYVAGWGQDLSGDNSPIKLKLSVPVFSKSNCVTKYRGLGAELTDKQICAGGKFAEDTCRGDSGGPLMKRRPDGIWESVAIVSFGYGCGRDGWPGVYTTVSNYLDFIRNTLRSSNA